LTIATKNYDEQALSATLSNDPTIETYQTLYQKAYKHIDDQWSFEMEMLADWGAADSLCEALWNATESAPNTTLAVSSPDAQTVSFSFTVVGTPTETFS